MIAVDDNSRGYNTTSHTFAVVPSSDMMSICYYSDSYNPDATSSEGLTNFTGQKSIFAYRTLMAFSVCPPNNCSTPVLRDPIIRSRNTTLRWRNTGSSYRVGYRLAASSSWISDNIEVTDTFYTINSLYPNTDYVYHVRQYCDTNGVSNWVEGEFNSSNVPCLVPMNLHVQSVTNNKVKLAWTPDENNIGYKVHLFNTYFDQAESDWKYACKGTRMNVKGSIRVRAVERKVCCPECGCMEDVTYRILEVVASGVGYTSDWNQPERSEKIPEIIVRDGLEEDE